MLNEEQRKTIENSLWVVNTILKEQNLQGNEDLKQDAILYMCKCIENFDESKGIKWTTYAYKNVSLYVKRKNLRDVRHNGVIELEINQIQDFKERHISRSQEFMVKYKIKNILYHCNEREKQVVLYKLQGYTTKQIADKMELPTTTIWDMFWRIKQRVRNMAHENED